MANEKTGENTSKRGKKQKEACQVVILDDSEEKNKTAEGTEKERLNRKGEPICEVWASHWDAICDGKINGSCKKAHPAICKHDRYGCRGKGKDCYFFHLEVKEVNKYVQEKHTCRDFKMGKCNFGSRCRWAHKMTEEEREEGMSRIWSNEVDEEERRTKLEFENFVKWKQQNKK